MYMMYMKKTEELQFIDVVEQVLEKEQSSLRRLSVSREGRSYFVSGLATRRMENALVYLICKKLLGEVSFKKWSLAWEDNYPANSKQHCDLTMTKHKPSRKDPDDLTKIRGPWHFIEFVYASPKKKIGKDIEKLTGLEDVPASKGDKGFQCGGRYIVMFSVVSKCKARQLKKEPIKNNYLNARDRKIWLLKSEHNMRKVSLDEEKSVFVIEFLKLTKHSGAS
jgi:hypothetical protein